MRVRWIGLVAMGVALAAASGVRAQTCDDFNSCTSNDMCSDGNCMGTPAAGASCDDFNECTINDHCGPDGECTGDPAPLNTACAGGCGTCQSLSPIPIPGLPLTCVGDIADNGSQCDTSAFGPCLSGSCNIIQTVPGFPAIAFCLPHPRDCPSAGNCKGACNPNTDRCDNNLSRCFGTCETCNGDACVPARQGQACDDSNVCTSASVCGSIELQGSPRGLCLPGTPSAGDTPTPTATVGGVSTPTRTEGTPPTPGACVGDCNHDLEVAINELITGVNIALGSANVSVCPSFDVNGDGTVAINELIGGVNAAQNGCAA